MDVGDKAMSQTHRRDINSDDAPPGAYDTRNA